MNIYNLMKTGLSGFLVQILICGEIFASEVKPCNGEENCWQCGENSYLRFDSDTGKVTVSGTGKMYNWYGNNAIGNYTQRPWNNIIGSIQAIEIGAGMTTVGRAAFFQASNLETVEIADSVTSFPYTSFQGAPYHNLIIGANSQLASISSLEFGSSAGVNILCKGSTEKCSEKAELFSKAGRTASILHYEKYDENNNLIEIWDDNGGIRYDEKGNILSEYDALGHEIKAYSYASDGSVSIYDAHGKLIGLQGKRILSVDEASALVKDNKNTFKLKYR